MPRVCLVTALAAESRPWLDKLRLRQMNSRGLRLYGSDTHLLLQTGVGKLPAAAAVGGLLHSRTDITHLVNIGIAGAMADIGSLHMARQIVDVASGSQWYPHLPAKNLTTGMHISAVHTVDQPNTEYQSDVLFDMEASAVCCAASRYLSTSQIHCIKVVSDNPLSSVETIDKRMVTELIQSTVPRVTTLLDDLMSMQEIDREELQARLASCANTIANLTHHTANDKIQLERLLQRHHALAGQLPTLADLSLCHSARDIRETLRRKALHIPYTYQ